jgi:hypothetical protein
MVPQRGLVGHSRCAEIFKLCRKSLPGVPVIIMTGFGRVAAAL